VGPLVEGPTKEKGKIFYTKITHKMATIDDNSGVDREIQTYWLKYELFN
jgi:hypothetical protein